jgi:hypothetical protein
MKIVDKKIIRIEKTTTEPELINLRPRIGSAPAILATSVIFGVGVGQPFPSLLINGTRAAIQSNWKYRAPLWLWIDSGDRIELETGNVLIEFEIYLLDRLDREITVRDIKIGFLSQRRVSIGVSPTQSDPFVAVPISVPSVCLVSVSPDSLEDGENYLKIETQNKNWRLLLPRDTVGYYEFVITTPDTLRFSCERIGGTGDLNVGVYLTICENIYWKNPGQQLPKSAKKTRLISREIELKFLQSPLEVDISQPIETAPWIPECATVLVEGPCTVRRIWLYGSGNNPAFLYLNQQSLAIYRTPDYAIEFQMDLRLGANNQLELVSFRNPGERLDQQLFVILEVES